MNSSRRWSASRAGGLLPACLVTTWALIEATGTLRHPTAFGYDDLLTALAAWLLVGCAGWSVLICTAGIVETTTAGRVRATVWVGCPPSWRRALVAGIGVALVGGAPGQAPVQAVVARDTGAAPNRQVASWQQLPVPARPLGSANAGSRPRVVVGPGDTLWHIACDRLRPTAPVDAVAEAVARLHRRNRELIGPDPDLIHPGQSLVVPPLAHRKLAHRNEENP